jgi:hypothetical protein
MTLAATGVRYKVLQILKTRFRAAILTITGPQLSATLLDATLNRIRYRGQPGMDFWADFSRELPTVLQREPVGLATEIVDAVDVADCCHPLVITDRGLVNIRIREDWLTVAAPQFFTGDPFTDDYQIE